MELHRLSTCVAAEAAQLLLHVTDMQHPLGWALVVDLAATLATWLVSVAINNSEAKRNAAETAQKHFTCPAPSGSAYDPYWSVMPPIMALYLAWIGSAASSELSLSLRQAAVLVGVLVWAGRLTFNWWGRVAKHWLAGNTAEEDWRYLDFKRQWGGGVIYWLVFSLGGFHLFPTLLTYIGCLPLWYALAAPSAHAAWGAWDTLGALCLVACIGLETVADAHMDRFLASPKTPPVCDSGLWGLSRHPKCVHLAGNRSGQLACRAALTPPPHHAATWVRSCCGWVWLPLRWGRRGLAQLPPVWGLCSCWRCSWGSASLSWRRASSGGGATPTLPTCGECPCCAPRPSPACQCAGVTWARPLPSKSKYGQAQPVPHRDLEAWACGARSARRHRT